MLKDTDIDRRTVSQYRMQPGVMDNGGIGRENRCLHRWAFSIKEAPVEKNANDVFEVEINGIRLKRIGEAIERLLQPGFEFSDDSYDSVNSRPVQHPARSPDNQPNVFVKLNIRGKFHSFVSFPEWKAEAVIMLTPQGHFLTEWSRASETKKLTRAPPEFRLLDWHPRGQSQNFRQLRERSEVPSRRGHVALSILR
jgi:hypothetical protein